MLPPPSNDNCAGAITLTVGDSPYTGNVAGATNSGVAVSCGGTADDDVWFKFTTTSAGNYTITVDGSASFDAVVDLRSGACNGSNVACADATWSGGVETITYSCAATTTYLIRVYDYYSGVPGSTDFTIRVTGSAANDNCATATTLTVGGGSIPGDVSGATNSGVFASCGGTADDDVWYKFTTSTAGIHQIVVASTSFFDAVVDLRSGACNGTNVACKDVAGNGGIEFLDYNCAASTTYYVRVYDYNSGVPATTGFTIEVTPPAGGTPAITLADNGTQVAAANVSQGTTTHILHKSQLSVTTANATLTGMSCTTAGTYLSSDITNIKVWYSANSTLDGSDVVLSTYTNPGTAGVKTFPAFSSQVINNGSTGYIFITADISASATIGRTIRINALTTANFTFSAGTKSGSTTTGGYQTFIGGDPCSSATSISGCGSGYSQTYTGGGSGTWSPGNCGYSTPGLEKVYSFVAPSTGTYNIVVTSASGYVDYFWKTSCASTSWTCIQDINSSGTYGSMSWTGGNTYYILLDDEDGTSGNHIFYINCPAASPSITLADNGTQVAAADVNRGTASHILHKSQLTVTTANATLTGMTCTTAGTYASADITNIKVWYSANSTLDGSDVVLSTYTNPGTAGAKTFPAFSSQVINSGTTGYIFITADIASGATIGNTIRVNALTTTNFTFSSGSKSGSTTTGGYQTIIGTTDPCASVISIDGCGASYEQVYAGGGSGSWSVGTCGYSTPGLEQIYSFVAPKTGNFYVVITAASGYVDYLYKASTCSGTGWTCIGDFSSTGNKGPVSLTSGITYYFMLDDEDGTAGTHRFYISSSLSTPSISAASGVTCNSFNANWSSVSGATKYYLDVSTNSSFSSFVSGYNDLDVGNVTTYAVNTNLNPSTTYYYRVRAYDGCATSSSSSYTSLTTSSVATPTANSATGITCNSFNANWATYSGATSYYLDVSTAWDFSSFVTGYNNLNVGLVTTYAVNSNLNPSTTYYYRVRAVSSCGTSSSSSYQSLSTSSGLSAPSISSASGVTCNSFNANWSSVGGATKYYLDVSTNSSFSSFVTGYNNLDVGLVTTYAVSSNLNPSVTYYYRVRAYNACGNSSNSSYTSVTTSSIATPIANAASGITCNSFNANWAAYAGATTYYLDVATNIGFTSFVTGYNNLDVGLVTTYAVNSNLNPSTGYYYRVRAEVACGTSPSSGNRSLTTLAGLNAPTMNDASGITCNSFNANWNTVAGATKYYLYVSTVWDFSSFVPGYNNLDVGNVLTYTVSGLNSGTTYYYRVKAYNTCGQSTGSISKTVNTSSGLSAPSTDWPDNETCTTFDANWYSVSGATKYYLDASTQWDFSTFLPGYNNLDVGNVLTYTVSGLTAGNTYYYRVRAWNASCNSSPSSSYQSASTTTPPSAPTSDDATNISCDQFRANWYTVWDATKYYLDVSTVSNFSSFVPGYNNLDVGDVDNYLVTGLSASTTYYYRVRSYDGCQSASSTSKSLITSVTGSGCGCANVIASLPYSQTGLTTCTSGNAYGSGDACGSNYMTGKDVVFSYVAPSDQIISVTLSGTSNYTGVFITDGCPSTGSCLAYSESSTGNPYICSANLTSGHTYYIVVSTYSLFTNCTAFDITVNNTPGAPPANDNCGGATVLTVGSSCSYGTYTNACATGSPEAAPPCGNYAGGDVWFTATVPASGIVNITTLPMNMTDGAMAVYKGNNCATKTYYTCNDDYCGITGGMMPEIRIRDVSIAGQKIWIRVWSENNGNQGTFKLCIYEPQPPAACSGNPIATDFCNSATAICEAGAYCGSTSDYYSADKPGNMCDGCGLFNGSIENNSWLSFQANATGADLHVEVTNCTMGIQMGIYSGTACGSFVLKSDIAYTSAWGGQFSFDISASSLTPGNTYYIMIDGYAGDECDYSIAPVSGVAVTDAGPNICSTAPEQIIATGGTIYTWSPTTGLSNPNISNPIADPGITTKYTVTTSGSNPLCPAAQDSMFYYYYNITMDTSNITTTTCYAGNDGEASPIALGGGDPYTYEWNTAPPQFTQTATGLAPGVYTVTATNTVNGCKKTEDIRIPQPPQIIINTSASDALCDGSSNGSVSVTSVENNQGSYTYLWNTAPPQSTQTANNIPAGSYIVTITDSMGCSQALLTPVVVSTSYETGNVYSWRGNSSTDWATASNWCRTGSDVPDSVIHDVIIPVGTTFDCYIPDNSNAYHVKNITINGSLQEVGVNSILNVYEQWTNNGSFVQNGGTVVFDGTSDYSIGGTNATDFGNLVINQAGTITAEHDITIYNDFTINGGTFNTATFNKSINLKGNWTNNGGVFIPSSGYVTFSGSSAQNVKSNANDFYNVKIENSVAPSVTDGVVLTDDMAINGVLTLTDGSVITGVNKVHITSGAANKIVPGSGNTNYTLSWINGNLRRQMSQWEDTYDFPVGNAAMGCLGQIKNNSSFSDIDYIDALFDDSPPVAGITNLNLSADGGTYNSVCDGGIWNFTPENGVDINYDLYLYFNNYAVFTGDLTDNQFGILSRSGVDQVDPGQWNISNLGTLDSIMGRLVADGFAYRKGLMTFSQKGIGIGPINPLPIELIEFYAECNMNNVLLKWTTLSETNNDFFTLEKSSDAVEFDILTLVQGAGNSNTVLHYSFYDMSPYPASYYRLTQTDYDGKSDNSAIISVNCDEQEYNFDIVNIVNTYLDNQKIKINYNYYKNGEIKLEMVNILGQTIYTDMKSSRKGINTMELHLSYLADGIYIISLSDESNTISKKIVITN